MITSSSYNKRKSVSRKFSIPLYIVVPREQGFVTASSPVLAISRERERVHGPLPVPDGFSATPGDRGNIRQSGTIVCQTYVYMTL